MARLFLFALLGLLTLCRLTSTAQVLFGYENPAENKLKNWDMEQNPSNNDWRKVSASVTRVSGGHTGSHAFKVTQRHSIDSGIRQTITGLKSGTNYYFSTFLKLTTNNPFRNGWSKLSVACKVGGATKVLARLPFQRTEWNKHWQQLGGDFTMSGSTTECWVRAEPLGATYLVDSASFIEIKKHSNWKAHFDGQIKKYRTNPLRVVGNLPGKCTPASTYIKVDLTRSEFGFGTAVVGKPFVGKSDVETKYRNFILKHFNWAVFENDMKWKGMESRKDRVKYGYTVEGIEIMKKNNMSIRGHALLWDVKPTNPTWVQKETGNALKKDADERIQDTVAFYKNDIVEWDIVNEALHQHFFEDITKYRGMLIDAFKRARAFDSKALLFLNDYQITRDGVLTSAIADMAVMLKDAGADCEGVGIQSHLRHLPIPAEVLEKRLQIACRLDMPCTITEFSVHSTNLNIRAAGLDMAMRVYFANPKVGAIVFWGFADQFGNFAPDYQLTQGTNFTPNKAGQTLLNLLKKWSTHEVIRPTGNHVDKTIQNAYRGNYKLTVTCAGKDEVVKDFYVGKGSNTIHL